MPAIALRDVHCRILYAGRVIIDASWRHRLCDPFWRVYINGSAGASIHYRGGVHDLVPGRIHLVPAWGDFQGRCVGAVPHVYLHVDPVGFASEWARGCFAAPLCMPLDPQRVALLSRVDEASSPLWRLRAQAAVLECLAHAVETLPADIAARLAQQLAEQGPVAPAIRHLEDHLHQHLAVADLAARCDLSADHFSKVFQARTGLTPSRYLQERRVAVAAERLLTGRDPIERIAADVGFANRYHFTRVFSRCMGIGPAAYRRGGRV